MSVISELNKTDTTRFIDLHDVASVNGSDFPIVVSFRKPIFGEDFIEAGMIAQLTGVELDSDGCVQLHFYLGDHYEHNKKLMRRSYYGTSGVGKLLTAEESGNYDPYYSVYAESTDLVSKFLRLGHRLL